MDKGFSFGSGPTLGASDTLTRRAKHRHDVIMA